MVQLFVIHKVYSFNGTEENRMWYICFILFFPSLPLHWHSIQFQPFPHRPKRNFIPLVGWSLFLELRKKKGVKIIKRSSSSRNTGAATLNMMMKKIFMAVVVVVVCLGNGGERGAAAAQVHHVVGNDQGWATSTDLQSWISDRVFKIGDTLWFAYSSASESIMEVQSLEEFMSCDLTNPIRMYTKGLDKVSLDGEGTRYFTSANLESCKNGLKLPVIVQPLTITSIHGLGLELAAEPPSSTSAAAPNFLTNASGLLYFAFALLFGFMLP